MTDLLDALGAAKEGSRELDREIWLSLGNRIDKIREYGKHEHERWVDSEGVRWAVALTNFSTSIDAALQLVPEGWGWVLTRGCYAGGLREALVRDPDKSLPVTAVAVTIPLAIVQAALRARAAHDSTEER